jgi:hypothetical protein
MPSLVTFFRYFYFIPKCQNKQDKAWINIVREELRNFT